MSFQKRSAELKPAKEQSRLRGSGRSRSVWREVTGIVLNAHLNVSNDINEELLVGFIREAIGGALMLWGLVPAKV